MTVQFPALGQFGRLGNQLFQVAATYIHALRNNTEPAFPLWERSYAFQVDEEFFHRILPLPAGEPYVPDWNYAPIPYWDDMALHGYFQSPKYWEGFEDVVRDMFTPARHFGAPYDPTRCCIHVRRTDYLTLKDYHPAPSLAWYAKAMELAREAGAKSFLLCSDDPVWCEHEPLFNGLPVSRETELHDLATMARSGHNIIANSTFSWWGAWLSGGEVIMPERWFGPALPSCDASQLALPHWTVLPEPEPSE